MVSARGHNLLSNNFKTELMKKFYFLVTFLLLSFPSQSQDELLSVNRWYLDYLILDGETIHNNITPSSIVPPDYPLELVDIHNLSFYAGSTPGIYGMTIGGIPMDGIIADPGAVIDENTINCAFLAETFVGCVASPISCNVQAAHFQVYVADGRHDVTFQYDITYDENNNKILTVTAENGNIAVYSGDVLLSVKDNNLVKFKLTSNPVNDILSIETSNNDLFLEYLVHSISGSKVLELSASTNRTIDVSSLQKGLYLLEIISDKRKSILKFIKS